MTRINLLRPRLPSQQLVARRRLTGLSVALSVLLLISLAAWRWCAAEVRRAAAALEEADARLAAEAERMTEWQAMRDETERLTRRQEALGAIPAAGERFAGLLAVVAAAAGDDCQPERIAVDPSGGLTVKGTASSHGAVADFVDRLRSEPRLAAAEFQSSVRPASAGRVAFDLWGTVAGAEGGAAQ